MIVNLFALPQNASRQPFSLSLHAMRGMAAVLVLFTHIVSQVIKGLDADYMVNIFNGSAAVCFFFVLSGLVVGMSLVRKEINFETMTDYCIRRVFRIMPLLAVTVTLGGLCIYFLDDHLQFKYLQENFGDLTLVKYLSAYIGYSLKPNPPIWSIFVELVGSALLPFMILTGRNATSVALCALGLFVLALFNLGLQHHVNFYMINFYAGLSILWWGRAFAEKIEALPKSVFWGIIITLFLAFYVPRLLVEIYIGDVATLLFGDPRFNIIELVAVTPLIAIVYYCPERFRLFATRPFAFLGDVSYSLYLTHYLLIILTINALAYVAPSLLAQPLLLCGVMAAVLVPLALTVAALSYRYIELPGIAMGKKFAAVFPFFRKPVAA